MEKRMTAFNIIKSLSKRGNAVIGSGCYAAAISANDNNKVIKIGNSINDPWLDYYRLIILPNQKNSCVPKVYSFYIDYENEYYVCIMERLEDSTNTAAADLCKEYVCGWHTQKEFIQLAIKVKAIAAKVDELLFILNKIKEHTDIFENDYSTDIGGTRKLDMHEGNFMFRNGLIVVTDPWCENDMADITDVSDWLSGRGIYTYR